MERHDELPGPSLPKDQEQERGIQECQLKRDQKKHQESMEKTATTTSP